MTGYVRWNDIRAEHVERAGGEEAVAAGKEELLAEIVGHQLPSTASPQAYAQLRRQARCR